LGAKAKDKATRDGTTSVKVHAIKIAEESDKRVNEHIAEMLEDCQHDEGVGVEVRQHHPIGGQSGMQEERHWWNHPCHDKVEESSRVPFPAPDDLASMDNGGAAILVRLIRNIAVEPLESPLRVYAAKRKKWFLRAVVLHHRLIGPGLLRGHGAARVGIGRLQEKEAQGRRRCAM
jgi:hypothetical protein